MLDKIYNGLMVAGFTGISICAILVAIRATDFMLDVLKEIDYYVPSWLWSIFGSSTTSTGAYMLSNLKTDVIENQVKNTNMIVESMNLEELYQLRDLVDEKGNSLKYHI